MLRRAATRSVHHFGTVRDRRGPPECLEHPACGPLSGDDRCAARRSGPVEGLDVRQPAAGRRRSHRDTTPCRSPWRSAHTARSTSTARERRASTHRRSRREPPSPIHSTRSTSASSRQLCVSARPCSTGLQQLDQALFTRLIASLQRHQVVAETEWPLDRSAAASAGQDSLYTSWLRNGQDRLVGLGLGPALISRSTILVDQPIGAEGATLSRNLGAGLMVMTPDIYDELEGSIAGFSDYTGELVCSPTAQRHGVRHRGRRSPDLRPARASTGDHRANPDLCAGRVAGTTTGHRNLRGQSATPFRRHRRAGSRRARRRVARVDCRVDHRNPRARSGNCSTTWRCEPTGC